MSYFPPQTPSSLKSSHDKPDNPPALTPDSAPPKASPSGTDRIALASAPGRPPGAFAVVEIGELRAEVEIGADLVGGMLPCCRCIGVERVWGRFVGALGWVGAWGWEQSRVGGSGLGRRARSWGLSLACGERRRCCWVWRVSVGDCGARSMERIQRGELPCLRRRW